MLLRYHAEIRRTPQEAPVATFDGYDYQDAFDLACGSRHFRELRRCEITVHDVDGINPPVKTAVGPIKGRYDDWE